MSNSLSDMPRYSAPLYCCPLCHSTDLSEFHVDRRRCYLRCDVCALVSVASAYHLSAAEEHAEYTKHENNPEDAGYRRFLGRLASPLLAQLPHVSHGLDFGCGPGPTLSLMLEEHGHTVSLYDKFFNPDANVFNAKYDFICATEVIEHLHDPATELDRLWQCLRPGGVLAIMTKLVISQHAFGQWHYKNDPTHIVFFSKETLEWLAQRWQAELQYFGSDAFIFTKGCAG